MLVKWINLFLLYLELNKIYDETVDDQYATKHFMPYDLYPACLIHLALYKTTQF